MREMETNPEETAVRKNMSGERKQLGMSFNGVAEENVVSSILDAFK